MDPRAEATRARLCAAVLELAALRPLEEITVVEIVALAGVNRSSFYQHFTDREELLATAVEHIETEAARADEPVIVTDPSQPPPELIRFAQHFFEHAQLYRLTLGPRGSSLVAARVRARTAHLIQRGIEAAAMSRGHSMPIEIEAAGTAGAILGVIEAWLGLDPLPDPAVAAGWMWQILGPDQ